MQYNCVMQLAYKLLCAHLRRLFYILMVLEYYSQVAKFPRPSNHANFIV